jgi:trk system potassium uptake protein TrkA
VQIIVVGAGQVGYNIAGRLAAEGKDVVVIEQDAARLRHVSETLDVQPVEGSGSSPSALIAAGIEEASMLVAVTSSDEVNIVACMVASAYGRKETFKVARVRDEEFFRDPRLADRIAKFVDLPINPEQVAAQKVLSLLSVPVATDVVTFCEGKVMVVGLPVGEASPLAGQTFRDLAGRDPERRILVGAIHRAGGVIIPKGGDIVSSNDRLYAVTEPENLEPVLEALGHHVGATRRVMISGSTQIAVVVALGLQERGVQTKIIEPDARRCYELADLLPKVVILQGEATDQALLTEEFIEGTGAFFGASDDEEENILSAVLAKRLGARRTIAVTDKASYANLIQTVGVDVVISPRLAAVSSILQCIRRGPVISVAAFADEAEALEFEATAASPLVGKPLRHARFPKGALLVAILRDGHIVIPGGDDVVESGDRVIVFSLKDDVPKVELAISGAESY